MTPATALAAALEKALDLLFNQDPDARRRCAALQGKVVAVEVAGFPLSLYFFPGPSGIEVLSHYEGEPDTRVRGTPLALARMAGDERESALFQGDVAIVGDTETGHQLQDILASAEWDWEEQLSRLTGDVVAHQAAQLLRGASQSLATGRDALRTDLSEYLQEEARLLPSRAEIEHFLSGVDYLRADADRLTARVERLLKVTASQP